MKLINADKLIEELSVDPNECPGCPEPEWLEEFIRILEEAPAVENATTFRKRDSGTYECFHCGGNSVIWDCDFDYADYGYEGNGIIQECHCMNCGAQITYMIPFETEE